MPKVNFANVTEYEGLPVGRYHVALDDGEVRQTGEESKNPDVDYWNCDFLVIEGVDENGTDQSGAHQYENFMLPPYEPFTLYNFMKAAFGLSEEDLKSGDVGVELHPDDAEKEDYVLLNEDEPLEVVMVRYRVKSGKNKGKVNTRFEAYDPDSFNPEPV